MMVGRIRILFVRFICLDVLAIQWIPIVYLNHRLVDGHKVIKYMGSINHDDCEIVHE